MVAPNNVHHCLLTIPMLPCLVRVTLAFHTEPCLVWECGQGRPHVLHAHRDMTFLLFWLLLGASSRSRCIPI